MSAVDLFSLRQAAQEEPGHIALVLPGASYTFRQLLSQVEFVITELSSMNLSSKTPVAVVGTPTFSTCLVLYALLELRIPIVCVHPKLTALEREQVVHHSRAAALFDGTWHRVQNHQSSPVSWVDGTLALMYTSGTTGSPKGAILSRRAFLAAVHASAERLGWQSHDRWLLCMPLSHVGGLSILLRCLAARKPLVLLGPGTSFSSHVLIHALSSNAVTLVSLVSTMLKRLIEEEPSWECPRAVRAILLGGASAPDTLLLQAEDRHIPVLTTYGMTETCSQIATESYALPVRSPRGVGTPLPSVEIRILNDEIWVRGPMLFDGYLHADGSMERPFMDGWFCTGDMGFLDAHQQLHILQRRTDLILSGGENVYPSEVENVFALHPDVMETCVFGVADAVWGQAVAIALIIKEGSTVKQIFQFASTRLASYKRPKFYCLLEKMNSDSAAKVRRIQIAEIAKSLLRSASDM